MQGAALGCCLLTDDLPETDFVIQTGSWAKGLCIFHFRELASVFK